MMPCLQFFRGLSTQLVNLNNRGSATVGFVLAVPLILLLAFAGLQLIFTLIIQSQLDQVAALTARALSFKEPPELAVFAENLIQNQPLPIESFDLKILHENEGNVPKSVVVLEVPLRNWIGISFNLRSISYAP